MRIIVYTGKGGVGKTSVSAATAIQSARSGHRTLIVSTDSAHSLSDSFDMPLGRDPVQIMPNLWGQEIQSLHQMERRWEKIKAYLETFLESQQLDVSLEEVLVFPGVEELLNLLEILEHYDHSDYEVIVVDCAPTGQTLRLLSYPDILRWWLERLFPIQRTAFKVLRPVAQPVLKMPLPSDDVMLSLAGIVQDLERMNRLLLDPEITSVRLVMNTEKMVIDETKRSFTYLNLFGFAVDAVIVNRLLPPQVTNAFFASWMDAQTKNIQSIEAAFSPLPILKVPLFSQEVLGLKALQKLGETCFDADPARFLYTGQSQTVTKDKHGFTLRLHLPFASKGDISLLQKGEELTIGIGEYRRHVILPRSLVGLQVKSAKLEEGSLFIRFAEG